MTPGEKLERALNFLMQLSDSMEGTFDNFQRRVTKACQDELMDVLKVVKTSELKGRK